MYRDWLPLCGDVSIAKKLRRLRYRHVTLPVAVGIALTKWLESLILVGFGAGSVDNLKAWTLATIVFVVLYIVFHERVEKARRKKQEIESK